MIAATAPAKVNLALHVTGQREDGYHLLDSLVVFADIGDRLVFEPADDRRLTVTGPFADAVPTGPENLIWQTLDLLDPSAGYHITLDKQLPHPAGLGGGSSDAAAVLRALGPLHPGTEPLGDQVLAIGADIPVCISPGPTRMRGIGEVLDPVPGMPPLPAVLVNPGVPTPTGAVFSGLARKDNPPMETPPTDPEWSELVAWLQRQRNDLETPARALVPEIDAVLGALGDSGAALARMSGSGASCFGLFAPGAAGPAAQTIAQAHPDWWVAETTLS